MIYTVFPDVEGMEHTNEGMPQDFPDYKSATDWQKHLKDDYDIDSTIDWNDGECV